MSCSTFSSYNYYVPDAVTSQNIPFMYRLSAVKLTEREKYPWMYPYCYSSTDHCNENWKSIVRDVQANKNKNVN
jgi:hypothetical protein